MERFWSKVKKGPVEECWEWQAGLGSMGYGRFLFEGRLHGAHRIAYLFSHGPVPQGHLVIHTCANRRCCNPFHLKAGTHADELLVSNLRERRGQRSPNARREKTHCLRGHSFDFANTYVLPNGHRKCRECARLRDAGKRAKKVSS